MPLLIKACFVCNQCGLEHNLAVQANVPVATQWPLTAQISIPKRPTGWTVHGTDARCPTHAIVQVVPTLDTDSISRNTPNNGT